MRDEIDFGRLREAIRAYAKPLTDESTQPLTLLFMLAGLVTAIFIPMPDRVPALIVGLVFIGLGITSVYQVMADASSSQVLTEQCIAETALWGGSVAADYRYFLATEEWLESTKDLANEIHQSTEMTAAQKESLAVAMATRIASIESELSSIDVTDRFEFTKQASDMLELTLGRSAIARFLEYETATELRGYAQDAAVIESQVHILNELAAEVREGKWNEAYSHRRVRERAIERGLTVR